MPTEAERTAALQTAVEIITRSRLTVAGELDKTVQHYEGNASLVMHAIVSIAVAALRELDLAGGDADSFLQRLGLQLADTAPPRYGCPNSTCEHHDVFHEPVPPYPCKVTDCRCGQ